MLTRIIKKLKIFHWVTLLIGLSFAYGSDDPKKNLSSDERLAFQYVKKGNFDQLKALIRQKKINLNMTDSDGNTLLHLAIKKSDHAMIQYLLSFPDLNTNIRNNISLAPVHLAIDKWDQKEGEKILRWLLKHQKTDPNIKEDSEKYPWTENTLLHLLVKENKIEMVKLLLSSEKLNPNLLNKKQYPPLHMAIQKGDKKIAILLIGDQRVNLNFHNEFVAPPLNIAIHRFRTEIVAELLENERVNPNVKDKTWFGDTPLHLAMDHNYIEMLQLLLAHPKLNPNITNKKGQTPLEYSFASGTQYQNRFDLLLADGRNDPKKVALHIDEWIQVVKKRNDKKMMNLLQKYREEHIINPKKPWKMEKIISSNNEAKDRSSTLPQSLTETNHHEKIKLNEEPDNISTSPQNSNAKKEWNEVVVFLGIVMVAVVVTVGGCYAVIYHFKNIKKEITEKEKKKT